MTAATPVRRKVDALLSLAGGSSNRAASEQAGVSPSTVAGWKRDSGFVRELDALKAVMERRPIDGVAVMDALDAAEARLAPPAPRAVAGRTRVEVRVPADASPRKRQQIVARALARGMAAAVDRAL